AAPQTALYLFPELEKVKLWTIADSDVYLTWALVGTVSAIVIAFINIRGVRRASLVQTFLVSFLLIVGLLLLAGGFGGGDLDSAHPLFTGGASGFIGVIAVVPVLSGGFDVVSQSADE